MTESAAGRAPRIAGVWPRVLIVLGVYVLGGQILSAILLSAVYILRYVDPATLTDASSIPRVTPEIIEELLRDPVLQLGTAAIHIGLALAVVPLGAWLLDRRPLGSLGFRRPDWRGPGFPWGVALGLILAAIVVLLIAAVGGRHVRGEFFGEDAWVIGPAMVLLVVAAAFAEEWLLRGYVYVNLREQASAPRVILFTALISGVVHVDNPGSGIMVWLNLFLMGCLLGELRELTGSLALPVGVHAGWNLGIGVVFGAELGGFHVPSMFRVRLEDLPQMLGGGGYGPEASLTATALFMGISLFLWKRYLTPPEVP